MQVTLLLVACVTLVIPQFTAAIEIGPEQEKILVAMRDKFQCCFENERPSPTGKHYTVLYWGKPEVQDVMDINFDHCKNQLPWKDGIFWIKPNYQFEPDDGLHDGCGFDAGLVKDQKKKHTEKITIWSFRKEGSIKDIYERCPNPQDQANGDVYMFNYFSPCTPPENTPDPDEKSCTTTMQVFSEQCKEHFRNLYVGYVEDFNGTAKLAEKRINDLPNAAMKQITVQPKDCTGSKDCIRTKGKNEL